MAVIIWRVDVQTDNWFANNSYFLTNTSQWQNKAIAIKQK